jgi:hypothetical protein
MTDDTKACYITYTEDAPESKVGHAHARLHTREHMRAVSRPTSRCFCSPFPSPSPCCHLAASQLIQKQLPAATLDGPSAPARLARAKLPTNASTQSVDTTFASGACVALRPNISPRAGPPYGSDG